MNPENPAHISSLQFGLLDQNTVQNLAEIPIITHDLFQLKAGSDQNAIRSRAIDQGHHFPEPINLPDSRIRLPVAYGLLDRRLGVSDKFTRCETCRNHLNECSGHFGFIPLALPVFHIGYYKATITILTCICKLCSRILLPPTSVHNYSKRIQRTKDYIHRTNIFSNIVALCRKTKTCPYCSFSNGSIRRGNTSNGTFRLVHCRYNINTTTKKDPLFEGPTERIKQSLTDAIARNKDIETNFKHIQEDLTPVIVLRLFQNMVDSDIVLLDMNHKFGRPEDLILQKLIVPPVPIRPTVQVGGSSTNVDDLTMKLSEICHINQLLHHRLSTGATQRHIAEAWDYLQLQVALYINSDLPGVGYSLSNPTRGLCQRLKGKQGRFRGNLSGKRVDFSSRSVISPDPNLEIDQVGVPVKIAKILTFPEPVNHANFEKMKQLIRNGPNVWPGACYVKTPDGRRMALHYGKETILSQITPNGGYTVERHLSNDDIVLFNRQPSLHKMSLMAHRVKVLPWKTYRFNECVCTPYNADFDGDEMNLHVPQTQEARAEAACLLSTVNNIISARGGTPLISATQDFITSAYLLTRKDTFFRRQEFCQLCCAVNMASTHVQLPIPCILKPVPLWSGKQLVSMLFSTLNVTPRQLPQQHFHILPDPFRQNFSAAENVFSTISLKNPSKNPSKVVSVDSLNGKPFNSTKNSQTTGKSIHPNSVDFNIFSTVSTPQEFSNHPTKHLKLSREPKLPPEFVPLRGFINFEGPSKTFKKGDWTKVKDDQSTRGDKSMDINDGWVIFRNSELICGVLDKAVLGSGSRSGLFAQLYRTESPAKAAQVLGVLAKLTSRFLALYGFSIGIDDVAASDSMQMYMRGIMDTGYSKCDSFIGEFKAGNLIPVPGATPEETLEAKITGTLSEIRDQVGNALLSKLNTHHNAPLIMATCGSKGSTINIAQMVACVGQQTLRGSRIPNGFVDRALPHFPPWEANLPDARGFCRNSFYSGLTPSEFWFHTMGGREGLVDTAVKTATTGYMQRRLVKCLEDLTIQYDGTVRNADNSVVQFTYGDDSIDPVYVETDEFPIDLDIILVRVVSFPLPHNVKFSQITITEALPLIKRRLGKLQVRFVGQKLSVSLLQPLDDQLCDNLVQVGLLDPDSTLKNNPYVKTTGILGQSGIVLIARWSLYIYNFFKKDDVFFGVSSFHIEQFFDQVERKLTVATCEPGTAVGAIAAQSIGEPATQMTLKTFHFAGVASMNITLGVPRLKEIINASQNLSTPIITVQVQDLPNTATDSQKEAAARVVKGRLEITSFGQICKSISQVFTSTDCYVQCIIDQQLIQDLYLDISVEDIVKSIIESSGIRGLKKSHITAYQSKTIIVRPVRESSSSKKHEPDPVQDNLLFQMLELIQKLPKVVVAGVPGVSRAVITHDSDRLKIMLDGTNFSDVLGTTNVDPTHTRTNQIRQTFTTLGIEAARQTIIDEIVYTMGAYGIDVDFRHVSLAADVMTSKGSVLGFTRYGLAKMKSSVLMLASFEKTNDHLFNAAIHGRLDPVHGVSEAIIMGVPMKVGTGLFSILHSSNNPTLLGYDSSNESTFFDCM